ncbi:MAG TPA: 2-phosphosulfolactate phosphatase [Bacteroidales bacterium]|nr:2-phosphosulfolactate phosphatase [Bacteroidales bacterium]
MLPDKRQIEICISPALYHKFHKDEAIVVVVDILRATTAICAAIENGAKEIRPVSTLEEAREFKNKGFWVAAERDGLVQDFADFGNSPFNFTPERVKDKTIVYSTTNGTHSIRMAQKSAMVVIGAFINFSALKDLLIAENKDVVMLCAGWKDKFCIEDTLFCGAMAEALMASNLYGTSCDSTYASIDLWQVAKGNVLQYIEKAAQRHRLKKNKLDDVLEYSFSFDKTKSVPVLMGDAILAYKKDKWEKFLQIKKGEAINY